MAPPSKGGAMLGRRELLACLLPAHAGRDQAETRPEEHHACWFWILTLDGAAGALVVAG
jgi:hypothetical protein